MSHVLTQLLYSACKCESTLMASSSSTVDCHRLQESKCSRVRCDAGSKQIHYVGASKPQQRVSVVCTCKRQCALYSTARLQQYPASCTPAVYTHTAVSHNACTQYVPQHRFSHGCCVARFRFLRCKSTLRTTKQVDIDTTSQEQSSSRHTQQNKQ